MILTYWIEYGWLIVFSHLIWFSNQEELHGNAGTLWLLCSDVNMWKKPQNLETNELRKVLLYF